MTAYIIVCVENRFLLIQVREEKSGFALLRANNLNIVTGWL